MVATSTGTDVITFSGTRVDNEYYPSFSYYADGYSRAHHWLLNADRLESGHGVIAPAEKRYKLHASIPSLVGRAAIILGYANGTVSSNYWLNSTSTEFRGEFAPTSDITCISIGFSGNTDSSRIAGYANGPATIRLFEMES